jgi:predicted ester cyclase
MMTGAYPYYNIYNEDLVAEGDKVVARVSVSGTHRGEMLGLAPTGKRIRTSGIEVFRIEDGKMAEHWATFDVLGMLRQIGVVCQSPRSRFGRWCISFASDFAAA